MSHSSPRKSAFVLVCLTLLLGSAITFPTQTAARETRTVADRYTIEIGFINEPPIQNDTNGLQIRITEGDEPVEGLESTLQAQAVFGGEARELPLAPVAGDPGSYTSVFIPTQPGEYSFLLTGAIGDVAIEETFHSSPNGVPLVASRLDYEFPTAAQGVIGNAASPAAVGGVLLIAGIIGFAIRHQRR